MWQLDFKEHASWKESERLEGEKEGLGPSHRNLATNTLLTREARGFNLHIVVGQLSILHTQQHQVYDELSH